MFRLLTDLDNISQYGNPNLVKINPSKTQFLPIFRISRVQPEFLRISRVHTKNSYDFQGPGTVLFKEFLSPGTGFHRSSHKNFFIGFPGSRHKDFLRISRVQARDFFRIFRIQAKDFRISRVQTQGLGVSPFFFDNPR